MSVAEDLSLALDPPRLMVACALRPDPWQERFLRERPARALLLASRQAGKSTVTAACALHEAVYRPPSTVLLLSPAQRQSAELLARVRTLLNRLPDPPAVMGEGALSVRLANGSRILSLPGSEATVRGFSADLLVIDEAARVDDSLYEAVRPMLAVTGGRLVALSTPWAVAAGSGRRGRGGSRGTAAASPPRRYPVFQQHSSMRSVAPCPDSCSHPSTSVSSWTPSPECSPPTSVCRAPRRPSEASVPTCSSSTRLPGSMTPSTRLYGRCSP